MNPCNWWIKRCSARREMSCYPIWEKVLMWIHMQCKIILKMESDGRESIIYTAREMNTTIRIIIIAREYNLWAGDSSLCQFKWKQSKCEESKRWGCQFMKKVWEGIIDTKISINIFQHVWNAAWKDLQVIISTLPTAAILCKLLNHTFQNIGNTKNLEHHGRLYPDAC